MLCSVSAQSECFSPLNPPSSFDLQGRETSENQSNCMLYLLMRYLGDDPRSDGGAPVSQHEAPEFFVVLVQL